MYEPDVVKFIQENAFGVCVDAGAGTGVLSQVMASKPNVEVVHAFDPIPYNCSVIRSLNNPKIKVHQIALGKTEGSLRFYAEKIDKPTGFPWINAMYKIDERAVGHGFKEYVDVEVKPLNKIINKADFIKIDCEGMEYDILLGSKGVYEQAFIVVELHGWGDYKPNDIIQFLIPTHKLLNNCPETITLWHLFFTPKK